MNHTISKLLPWLMAAIGIALSLLSIFNLLLPLAIVLPIASGLAFYWSACYRQKPFLTIMSFCYYIVAALMVLFWLYLPEKVDPLNQALYILLFPLGLYEAHKGKRVL